MRMAEKLKATVKDKSSGMKRKAIAQKLVRQGFESSIAHHASENLIFADEEDDAALRKAMEKAIRSYSRKYQGAQLRNKVLAACIKKGFSGSDILAMYEETENQNEEMDM